MLTGESNVKKPKPKLHSTIKFFKCRSGHSQPSFKFLNLKLIMISMLTYNKFNKPSLVSDK